MSTLGVTLAIDASTYRGSVAVLRERQVIAAVDAEMRGKDEERLMPAVASCLAVAGVDISDLARVVCGAGPGSFTSLRIAASIAKGICHGRGLPLFAASSLALIAAAATPPLQPGEYLVSLDAMRGERYVAQCTVGADGVAAGTYTIERGDRVDFDGMPRLAETAVPHARGVAALLPALIAGSPVDLATWEPDYGRLPEAQVRWEAAHGRPLAS